MTIRTDKEARPWERWIVIVVGFVVAMLGEPAGGAMLMIGYEVGRSQASTLEGDRR